MGGVTLKFESLNRETVPLNWKVACLSDTKTDSVLHFYVHFVPVKSLSFE